MSKAALNAGLKTLAIETRRRRIAVAVLHPGWVKTEMGGPGAEVEVANSVAGLRHGHRRADAGAERRLPRLSRQRIALVAEA